jgi:hypothetical protein
MDHIHSKYYGIKERKKIGEHRFPGLTLRTALNWDFYSNK